jgi:hypothetical protein
MAIKDPLVSLFAIMTTSQLLGLSFIQYFPTWVDSHLLIVQYNDLIWFRLTQTLGFNTTNTLLLAA